MPSICIPGHNAPGPDAPVVSYAAPKDPTARHRTVRAFKLVFGWGYVGKSMACRFHLGIDLPYLAQIEVFGYYVGVYR